jgi:hypothetical protein
MQRRAASEELSEYGRILLIPATGHQQAVDHHVFIDIPGASLLGIPSALRNRRHPLAAGAVGGAEDLDAMTHRPRHRGI